MVEAIECVLCWSSLQLLLTRNLAKRAMRLLCDSAVVVCWSCGVKKITEAHKVSDGVMKVRKSLKKDITLLDYWIN